MLRPYQQIAAETCKRLLGQGARTVLVLPTGGGKTITAEDIVSGHKTLWLTHRRDLKDQAKARFAGNESIVVRSILNRKRIDGIKRIVQDECHHGTAATWQRSLEAYPGVPVLGLTATPERGDGAPLGDVYQELVVGAQYSDLLRDGYLTECRVFEPRVNVDRGIALSPAEAYLRHTPGQMGFTFVSNLKQAHRVYEEFQAAGVSAAVIDGTMPMHARRPLLSLFEQGHIRMLVNVNTLTEGFDSPATTVCILARRCAYPGLYLQIVGRVLRTFHSKIHAYLLDLVSATRRHGFPTMDREYGLSGRAIRQKQAIALRQCYMCGAVMTSDKRSCITCATTFIPGIHKPPKVLNISLREVYAGSETPNESKIKELVRILETGMRWAGAAKHYERLFGSRPGPGEWGRVPQTLMRREHTALGSDKRASAIIKTYTGEYPPWSWSQARVG